MAEVRTHKDCGGTVIWDLSGGFCTGCHAEGLDPEDAGDFSPGTPLIYVGDYDPDWRARAEAAEARAEAAEAKLAAVRAYCRDEGRIVREGVRVVAVVRTDEILAIIGSEEGAGNG